MLPRNEGETEEQYLKRLSCFSHRLQLVMAIFDKFRISPTRLGRLPQIESTQRLPVFATVISKARKLVSKFNTSSVATPRLISLSGRKLLTDVSTRWSSNYFVMDCLYQLRKPVSQVCQELGWDELSNSKWIMLKSIIDLLQPFAAYTQLVSGDKYVTISSAIPCIEELKLHLQKSAESPGLHGVACAMLADLYVKDLIL